MRFPRRHSIYRGPVDSTPLLGVLFLLVIFMLLGSLVYTPGVLVDYAGAATDSTGIITVTRDNKIVFAGKTNTAEELGQFRADTLRAATNQTFAIAAEPGASRQLVDKVRDLFQISLPEAPSAQLAATGNPTVIVEVNFRGQYFLGNQLLGDKELGEALKLACGTRTNMTLAVAADKATPHDAVMRVCRIGRQAGMADCLLLERPGDPGLHPTPGAK